MRTYPGNALSGPLAPLPLPCLVVNLSRNQISGNLSAFLLQPAAEMPALSPFPSALVVDLSHNNLSGTLPSASEAKGTAWEALLETAALIDLTGGCTGACRAPVHMQVT